MIVTYQPEDSPEPQTWVVSLGRFRAAEMEGIERRTKLAFGTEYRQALYAGNASARRALLWTLLRREHHTLRYEDVDFADDELKVELDKQEWGALRAEAAKNANVPEDVLAAIDGEIAVAPDAPGKAPTPSPESETSTG